MSVDYDGRRFGSVENSASGEVGPETVFEYRQEGDVVWATYSDGRVRLHEEWRWTSGDFSSGRSVVEEIIR